MLCVTSALGGCAVPSVLSAPAVQASMPEPQGTQEPLSPLVVKLGPGSPKEIPQ
jgi:hypothetical protein